MNLEACLPPELRGPSTTIKPIAMGFSGAGVYRVEAAGKTFALKLARPDEDDATWRRALGIQRAAADAGLSPPVVHVDEVRGAVLTAFVVDQVFPARYLDPRTHGLAVAELGRLVSRVHALPLPADAPVRDPRALLAQLWGWLRADFVVPDFVPAAIEATLAAAVPDAVAPVLGHNDLNPSNLIYDGQSLLVLDWATAGPADPFFDLATLAVFLRMDEATCLALLAAYEAAPARAALPPRFVYTRWLAATLVGTMMLHLARRRGHAGAGPGETLASTPTLAELYQRMRAGAVNPATTEGQWAFGGALLKESLRFSSSS